MRGLGYSIDDFKESLNNSMNQYRVRKDGLIYRLFIRAVILLVVFSLSLSYLRYQCQDYLL